MDLPHGIGTTARSILLFACIARASAQVLTELVSHIRESLAPDFVIIRGNGVFASREAWIDALQADFKKPNAVRYERIPEKIEISSVSPIAAEQGHWVATLPDGKRAYGGTYLAMWRRAGSEWQIRSELFVLLSCDDEASCAAYGK